VTAVSSKQLPVQAAELHPGPVPVLDGLFLYLAVTVVSSKQLPVQAAELHSRAGTGRAVLVPGCDGCVQQPALRENHPPLHGAVSLPAKPLHQVGDPTIYISAWTVPLAKLVFFVTLLIYLKISHGKF
jgi:hypothetical protein